VGRGSHLAAMPLTRDQANEGIRRWHRHHKRVQGFRFAIGAVSGSEIVGIGVVARPRARNTDQYRIAEVSRVSTNGHRNACSFLYSRCARAADAMGFDSIQTFTLPEESGVSLRAAGWIDEGIQPTHGEGREGSRPGRRRDQPEGPKRRWRMWLNRKPATKDLRATQHPEVTHAR